MKKNFVLAVAATCCMLCGFNRLPQRGEWWHFTLQDEPSLTPTSIYLISS
jgi:hypothetical protein